MRQRFLVLVAVTGLLAACSQDSTGSAGPAPATVEAVYEAIAALDLEDSAIDAYLLERAVAEGPITLYLNSGGGSGEEIAEAWSSAFAAVYPDLAMQFVALTPSDLNPRLLSEHRSGRAQADVVRTSASLLAELRDEEDMLATHFGVLQTDGMPDWTVSPTGVVSRVTPSVIPWSSERVPDAGPPQTWDDFLLEEYGGCSLGATPSWIVGMLDDRGLEATVEWFERFIENDGRMVIDSGATALRQLASGEVGCVVHVNAAQAETARLSGLPIDWVVPESSPTVVTAFSVLETTPHPHAAALFVRWATGREASQIAASFGEASVRTDVVLTSERLAALADPSDPRFAQLRLIDLDVASQHEAQAAEILATYHTPNVVER